MAVKTWVVLLTDLSGAYGGIPAFNRELVKALEDIARARGWTVKLLVLNDAPPSPRASAYRAFGGNRVRFVAAALQASWNADHVLFGHVHLSPLALVIPRARCWMVAHGIEVWGPLSWLRKRGLSLMDRVLCVSGFTRDQLVTHQKVKAERILLFPNTARLESADAELRLGDPALKGKKIILTVSRLWPEERYKKIDRVIEALPEVLRAVPDAAYTIAGEGGDRHRLEKLARDLGVQEHVLFVGALSGPHLRLAYEACDLFILPSLGEGFGIVYLEAMACAKPCVGARATAVPEIIDDGRTGLLVDPDSSQSIAAALIRLLQDEHLRKSMGQAGRERFLSEYSPEHFQRRLSRIMEQCA